MTQLHRDQLPFLALTYDQTRRTVEERLGAGRRRVAIFGASSSGALAYGLLRSLGAQVVAVFDSQAAGVTGIDGLEVQPAADLGTWRTRFDVLLLATSSPCVASAMTDQATAAGLRREAILALPDFFAPAPVVPPPVATPPPAPLPNPRHLWEEDATFQAIYAAIAPFTLVDQQRCHILYQWLHHTAALPGQLAEIGVYRGGTARLIATTRRPRERRLHLFDTFAGMPETDPTKDVHTKGNFSDTSLAGVQRLLAGVSDVVFHPGLFPDTAAGLENERFAFVHVDVDIYSSVRDCCRFFYPRLVTGGVMVFDDYGFRSCPGAKDAVDEFFAATPEKACGLSTGQALVVKGVA